MIKCYYSDIYVKIGVRDFELLTLAGDVRLSTEADANVSLSGADGDGNNSNSIKVSQSKSTNTVKFRISDYGDDNVGTEKLKRKKIREEMRNRSNESEPATVAAITTAPKKYDLYSASGLSCSDVTAPDYMNA